MEGSKTLTEYAPETDAKADDSQSSPPERLLKPVSDDLALKLVAGDGHLVYLENHGKERYLLKDEHDRWIIIYRTDSPESGTKYTKWVYLPDGKPEEIAKIGPEHRTVLGYRYVQRQNVPEPDDCTVTASIVGSPSRDVQSICFSCDTEFEDSVEHALHCWSAHPQVPKPSRPGSTR